MSNTTGPKPIRVDIDIDHDLISDRTLRRGAGCFYNFIWNNHLQHCMQTMPNDVRWTIFFVPIVRYITAHPELGKLVESSDIPF
jgi:formyltetrahydrofolate hydrolase